MGIEFYLLRMDIYVQPGHKIIIKKIELWANHGFGQQRGQCSLYARGVARGRSQGGRRHPLRKRSLSFG
jgi:hypothetical protein